MHTFAIDYRENDTNARNTRNSFRGRLMDLQKAADEAMAYLDSVGVAAEYEIKESHNYLLITCYINGGVSYFECYGRASSVAMMMSVIQYQHSQKNPA